jgi:peptide/nickel transport system ATP-binding protein
MRSSACWNRRRIAGGEIRLKGERIDNLRPKACALRGKPIGMIFQDPLTSLNPLQTIGEQLVETIRTHLRLSGARPESARWRLLDEVGIPAAASGSTAIRTSFPAACGSAW